MPKSPIEIFTLGVGTDTPVSFLKNILGIVLVSRICKMALNRFVSHNYGNHYHKFFVYW